MQEVACVLEQFEFMDRHPPGCAFDGLARARQLVERLAFVLQRRIHRRHLLDLAAELLERSREACAIHVHRAPLQHPAFGVARVRQRAEPHLRAVFLDGIEAELGELGGFAKQ